LTWPGEKKGRVKGISFKSTRNQAFQGNHLKIEAEISPRLHVLNALNAIGLALGRSFQGIWKYLPAGGK